MGGQLTRVFRNFNLENRAHRLIAKEKLAAAPRHPVMKDTLQTATSDHPDIKDKIYKKDDVLLSRLKEVYVDSSDPPIEIKEEWPSEQVERRLPKQTMRSNPFAALDVEHIPKGKISILEALTLLNNHKHSPDAWTAEKIAQDYDLKLHDAQAVLHHFIPFDVKIIKQKDIKQITET
ncbi:NADH dehydrogenase [ubiquinone] 1 alpha subcomplex assembly factor 4 [Discoglossus pictus]